MKSVMPQFPRPLLITVAILLLLLLIYWVGGQFFAPPPTDSAATTVTVQRGTLAAFVTATGRLNAERESRLSFAVSGTITEIAEVGDTFTAGQSIATLTNPESQLRYDEARAGLAAATAQRDQLRAGASQGEINAAQAQLTAAQLALSVAEAQLEAIAPESRATSTEAVEVERARAAVVSAEAALRLAIDGAGVEELAILEAQVQAAQARLSLAEVALQSETLTAPFVGQITERLNVTGERVSAGQPLLTLTDFTSLYLAADVDEVDIGRVAVGQLVTVTIDAFPTQPLSGTITNLATAATPQRGTITYLATIALGESPIELRLDMSAEAQIRTADENEVLLLPQNAIRYAENQPYVVVRRNNVETQQPVTLGASDDRDVAVLAGVEAGDVVVLP
jgi:HlyD family secretion protein